jgi:hypothetical protein
MRPQRVAAVVAATGFWLLVGAAPALADPAGPTDYQTEIIGIEPEVGGFSAEMIGGDSFLLLSAEPGVAVEVVGYRGEPYLRFSADGAVEENRRSPTAYLNEDRYAVVDVPPEASPDAEPEWRRVAADGSYAWHDHRAHWMNEVAPPGRGPGDVILEGVVPLVVDGVEVDLTVRSVWQPGPSPVPLVLGGAAGLGAAIAVRRRGIVAAAAAALGLAAGALVVGLIDFLSVPAETAPSPLLWVVPALAVAASGPVLLGAVWPRRLGLPGSVAPTLVLGAAVVLAVWGVGRWEWLWRAVLPTASPFWVDRLVTVAAAVGGVGAAVEVVRARIAGAAAPDG